MCICARAAHGPGRPLALFRRLYFPNQESIFGRSVLDSAPTDWPPDHIARHTRRPCACQAERTDTDDDEQCSLGGHSRRRRAAKAKERRRGGSCITRRRSSLRIHFCVVRRGPRSIDGRPYLTGSHGQHTDWPIRALTTTGARWSPVGRKPLPAAHRSTCAPPAPAILNPSRRHLLFPSEGGRARRLEPKTG